MGRVFQLIWASALRRDLDSTKDMDRWYVLMLVVGASAATTINVGMLFRLTNDGDDLGNAWKSTAAASLLALNQFNTRNSSLIPAFGQLDSCDVQLAVSPIVYDSQSTIGATAKLVVDGYANWQAIIGPARSATTVTAATLGGMLKIPQIGYWSSSPTLENVADYPYFGRVCPSDLATNKARMAFFKLVNWNRVGLLYINDAWGAPLASDLAAEFAAIDGWLLKPQAFTAGNVEEMRSGLTTLKTDGYKIFVYLSYEADTLLVLQEAVKLGMIGKEYAWTFGDIDMVESLNGAEFDEDVANAIKGSTAIFPAAVEDSSGDSSVGWKAMVDVWGHLDPADYNNLMPAASQLSSDFFTVVPSTLSDLSAFSFDAVAALGLAACNAANTDADAIFNAYKALDFAGLTGRVKLNNVTGTRSLGTTNIKLRNLQPGSENSYTDVAQFDAETNSLNFVRDVIYWDGTANAPSADWPTEEWWETSWGIAVLIVVPVLLCGGAMVLAYRCYGDYTEKREKKMKREKEESIMRGVSLSYLLESLEADRSLEVDSHTAVTKGIELGLLHEYDKTNLNVKDAAAVVEAARTKLLEAEELCAKLELKVGDKVRIIKKGKKYEAEGKVLELHWSPEEVTVQLAWFGEDKKKKYKHTDLLKLADVPHFEALTEAEAAVATAEAKLKQICLDEQFVPRNARGNYDPNFYQIKEIMAGCPVKWCDHAPGECPGQNALGKGVKCPRDLELDCSIADFFYHKQATKETDTKKGKCAGRATRFLSWTWAYKVSTLQKGIEAWRKSSDQIKTMNEFFWICFFCNNQFRPNITLDTFKERVMSIGHVIAILDTWKNPEYLKRKWCIYEVFEEQKLYEEKKEENHNARDAAIQEFDIADKAVKELDEKAGTHHSPLTKAHEELEAARAKKMSAIQKIDGETTMKLTFTLPEEEATSLRKQLEKPNEVGFQEVVDFLFKIDVSEAKCGNQDDEKMIDDLIEEEEGGTREVNKVVRQRLIKWVANIATADKKALVKQLIHRHTVNWYRENAECTCCGLGEAKCMCASTNCWDEEKFEPKLARVAKVAHGMASAMSSASLVGAAVRNSAFGVARSRESQELDGRSLPPRLAPILRTTSCKLQEMRDANEQAAEWRAEESVNVDVSADVAPSSWTRKPNATVHPE